MSQIVRRPTRQVQVGSVLVGGDAPVVVQSMTNTDTVDVTATVRQVQALAEAGSELVRLTVNTLEAAAAVPRIRERLDVLGCRVPLIGDFHFNGHKLLTQVPECAEALAKLRINPGNIGRGNKRDEQFATLIEVACRYDKPVRIGVNWGSLDQALAARMMDENARLAQPEDAEVVMRRAMVASALESAKKAEELGLARRQDHPVVQDEPGAGPDCRLPRPGRAVRLSAASGADRSGHGLQGHRRLDRRPGRAAAGRHRRHHPHFPDPRTGRRAHPGSPSWPGNPADHGAARLHPAWSRPARAAAAPPRTVFQELAQDIQTYLREPDAGLAQPVSRRRSHEAWR